MNDTLQSMKSFDNDLGNGRLARLRTRSGSLNISQSNLSRQNSRIREFWYRNIIIIMSLVILALVTSYSLKVTTYIQSPVQIEVIRQGIVSQPKHVTNNRADDSYRQLSTPLAFPMPKVLGALQPTAEQCCQSSLLNVSSIRLGRNPPRLLIIGVQKGSTSFMTALLRQNSVFLQPKCPYGRQVNWIGLWKEFHFFDFPNYNESVAQSYVNAWHYHPLHGNRSYIKFEATPSYQLFSYVPCRIKQLLPDTKLVIILRDPTDRLISDFKMMYAINDETSDESFTLSVQEEIDRLKAKNCTWQGSDADIVKSWQDCFGCEYLSLDGWRDKAANGRLCFQGGLPHGDLTGWEDKGLSRLVRGIYAPMLAWWLQYFGLDQLLIVNMDDVKKDPIALSNRIAKFVGSPPVYERSMMYTENGKAKNFVPFFHNDDWREPTHKVERQITKARKVIKEFYMPLNIQLYAMLDDLGLDFGKFQSDLEDEMPVQTDQRNEDNQQVEQVEGADEVSIKSSAINSNKNDSQNPQQFKQQKGRKNGNEKKQDGTATRKQASRETQNRKQEKSQASSITQ